MEPGWNASIRLLDLGLRGLRVLLAASCVGGSLFLSACKEQEGAGDPVEQVPQDPRGLYLSNWTAYRRPGDDGLYFLSRFELRGEDLWVFRGRAKGYPRLAEEAKRRGLPRQADLPLGEVGLGLGQRLAKAYFGRLPSVSEWKHAVTGHGGYRFPWGDRFGLLRANTLELGLERPTPVGTFESGRDPAREDSCYDLLGNVAEWTQDPLFAGVELRLLDLPEKRPVDFYGSLPLGRQYLQLQGLGLLGPVLMVSPCFFGPFEAFPSSEAFGFATLGFSYLQDLSLPWIRGTPPLPLERYGLRVFDPREGASDLGLRVATDPWTFVARLESAKGRPGEGDLDRLRLFLLRYPKEFRAAYQGRMRLREALGLGVPGPWARALGEILR